MVLVQSAALELFSNLCFSKSMVLVQSAALEPFLKRLLGIDINLIKYSNYMNEELYEDQDPDEDQDPEEWCPLKTAALMKRLVIQKCYKKEDEICAICLEQMYQRTCEYLPCTHVFHFPCLRQLIEQRIYTCPLCRYDFNDMLALTGNTEVQQPVLGTVLGNFTFTLFTNMDVYDFLFELLLQNYQLNLNREVDVEDEVDTF
jgi:hypothetical protein